MTTNGNGWGDAAKYLGTILAALSLLAIISGSVWAWAAVNYQLDDACKRVDRLEGRADMTDANSARVERKVDRLLIEQGINPDDFR
jgi:hypothetical protein